MNIKHRPHFDTDKAARLYSEKDGAPVKYVCTSSATGQGAESGDIFYRETPHPEFGNRYFILFRKAGGIYIGNADSIEKLDFYMVDVDGELHYSQHRHDYNVVNDTAIDGGRAYLRRSGNLTYPVKRLNIVDGNFVDNE